MIKSRSKFSGRELSVIYTYELHTSNRVCMFYGETIPEIRFYIVHIFLNDLNKAESAFIRN